LRSTSRRVTFGVLLLLTSSLVGPLLAPSPSGADVEGFALTPYSDPEAGGSTRSTFVIEASPGQTISDRITLINNTDEALSFQMFGSDGYNTVDGAFALRMPDPDSGVLPESQDVGKWLNVPVESFRAPPRTRNNIPFTITVPLNAAPGDHVGGIVALDDEARGGNGQSVGIAVRRAKGVRIYVRVEGPVQPGVAVTDVQLAASGNPLAAPIDGPSRADASFVIVNTGNVTLRPRIAVKVTDLFGRVVYQDTVDGDNEILPGQRAQKNVPIDDLSGFGPRYRLTVTADDGTTTGSGSGTAWVPPWLLLIAVLLVVGAVVFWRRLVQVRGTH
jgi:hypothetical protein